MNFIAICALIGGLAAWPAVGQEPRDQVSLQVPEAVVFPVTNLHSKAAALSTVLTFDHARLARGSRLRISVRAEGLDFGTGTPARISYAAHASGGTPFNGSLRDTDYTPVFEGDSLTLSGRVEIDWSLQLLGRIAHSGPRVVTLRWKAEAIPGTTGRPGTSVSRPGRAAVASPDRGEREDQGPGRRSHGRPGPQQYQPGAVRGPSRSLPPPLSPGPEKAGPAPRREARSNKVSPPEEPAPRG
jgi:hypothetical protein